MLEHGIKQLQDNADDGVLDRSYDILVEKRDQLWKEITDKKVGVVANGTDFFFIEWHIISGMKTLRLVYELDGPRSKSFPCHLCCVHCSQLQTKSNKPFPTRPVGDAVETVLVTRDDGKQVRKTVPGLKPMFDLPPERIHPRTMHCDHRITEAYQAIVAQHVARVTAIVEGQVAWMQQ